MLTGPVARFEMIRAARRPWTYALRALFGLVVLGVVWVDYFSLSRPGRSWFAPAEVTPEEMARFGSALVWAVMLTQGALVLSLTPALVADAVAAERQGKTLGYLLTSALSGADIVVGKVVARLAGVLAFLALVLPVMALLTLFGGVDPRWVLLGDAVIAASALFLTGLSVLASLSARRPRDAVGLAYTLTAAWLVLPGLGALVRGNLPAELQAEAEAVREVAGWVWPASPFGLIPAAVAGPDAVWDAAAWAVASQAAWGVALVAVASWRLRPAFRRLEGRAGRTGPSSRRARRRRWPKLPPCGDDPVYWKEAYYRPASGGLGRRLVRGLVLASLAGAVVGLLAFSGDAFTELLAYGYSASDPMGYRERESFNMALRAASGLIAALWLLGLAGTTAASVTSEREQDTWLSLLATPLDGRDILRGKVLGALRATAGFGVALAALALIGLASGAVHPVGVACAAGSTAVVVWFALALGMYASLASRSTWRARVWAQGLILAPGFCCLLPLPSAFGLVWMSLWSYDDLKDVFGRLGDVPPFVWLYAGGYYVGGLIVYAVAACLLTSWAFGGFDARADRPRRAGGPPPAVPAQAP